jgi:hypothetical protein
MGFPKFDQKLFGTIQEQRHLFGAWFKPGEYPVLSETINALRNMDDAARIMLAWACHEVVVSFASAGSLPDGEKALKNSNAFDVNPDFMTFVDGISAGDASLDEVHQCISEGVKAAAKSQVTVTG